MTDVGSRDPATWKQRIAKAKPGEEAINIFEEALQIWPSATEIWLAYLKIAEDRGKLLARCLPLSVDPKLYEAYIDHIKTTNAEELGAAFEYVLKTISYHPDSGSIWKMYIDWLGSQPVANEWEETFRRDKVRKAYKKAVTLPLANIEALWRNYGQFETRISRVSARKFIDERSAAYMKARSAYRTYQSLTQGLTTSTMPSPADSRRDAPRWRQYVEWERNNPLELDDQDELSNRVNFAYIRATHYARWSPELWFDAGSKNSAEFWERGAQALPESFLLAFKISEHHELNGDYDKCKEVLMRLIKWLDEHAQDSTYGWVELVRCTHRMRGVDEARNIIKECMSSETEPTSAIYIVAANIEGVDNHRALEDKIWEFAYTKFGDSDEIFVAKYLDFLFARKDLLNARSVFEQALQSLPAAFTNKRNFWERMLKHEAEYAQESNANLQALRKLEKRFMEKFTGVDEVSLFMHRFGADAPSLAGSNDPQFGSDTPIDDPMGGLKAGSSAAPSIAASPAPSGIPSTAIVASQQARLPDGHLANLLTALPPSNVYDGPSIDSSLLLQFVLNANI